MDGNIEYKLGQIDARLEENEKNHVEILASLKEIACGIKQIQKDHTAHLIEFARLKGKASVFGSIFGFAAGIVATVIAKFCAGFFGLK